MTMKHSFTVHSIVLAIGLFNHSSFGSCIPFEFGGNLELNHIHIEKELVSAVFNIPRDRTRLSYTVVILLPLELCDNFD